MHEPGVKQCGTADGFCHEWLCLACKAWRVGFLCCLPRLGRFVTPECSAASLVSPGRILELAATGELTSLTDCFADWNRPGCCTAVAASCADPCHPAGGVGQAQEDP